jgi:hypothetical protein
LLLWLNSFAAGTKFKIFDILLVLDRFMRQMTTEKLFEEGKYMVIYLYPETVKMDERQFFLWNLEDMSTAKVIGLIDWFHSLG